MIEMNTTLSILILNVFIYILWTYFISNCLESKTTKRKAQIATYLMFLVEFYLLILLRKHVIIKLIISICINIIIALAFYKGSITKRVIVVYSMIFLTMIVELINNFINLFIFDIGPMQITNENSVFGYSIYFITLYLLFRFVLNKKVLFDQIDQHKTYFAFALIILIQTLLFGYISILMMNVAYPIVLIVVLMIMDLLICIFLFKTLQSVYEYTKNEHSNVLMRQQYVKQLEEYVSLQNKEERTRELRHDILNYLENAGNDQ
ncbi:MAG: hypothetical protein RSC27_04535 [Bacilli bacterium]